MLLRNLEKVLVSDMELDTVVLTLLVGLLLSIFIGLVETVQGGIDDGAYFVRQGSRAIFGAVVVVDLANT